MIRHSCAACGRSINRTDSFFEHSNGILCQDCLARLAHGKASRPSITSTHCPTPPPAWAILPELAPHGHR